MARRGAPDTIIVHETAPASYGWPTVKNSNTNVVYDIVRKQPGKAQVVDLFNRTGLNCEAAKKQAQSRDFKRIICSIG
jgi:hypothetical protein